MSEAPAPDLVPETAFRRLGHGGLFLPGSPSVAIDPWKVRAKGIRAGLLLVTRAHADHCCVEDLRFVAGEGATAAGPAPAAANLATAFGESVRIVRPGDEFTVGSTDVSVLGARAPERAAGFTAPDAALTFVLRIAGATHLVLGGSLDLPLHAERSPDIAYFAVGGTVFPTPEEAAEAAARVRPCLAVANHWGDVTARFDAAKRFVSLCDEIGVRACTG